jgi:hypothetical protein
VNQSCGLDTQPAGFAVSVQTDGDCLQQVCDGNGQVIGQPDDADIPNDANDCTVDGCSNGSASHTPKSPGASCTGSGGAKVCNAATTCVECVAPTDCASGVCTAGFTCGAPICNFVPNSLILSEVKWRGTASAQDDFVELYNPGNAAVTLTSAWTIESRSETAGTYTVRFTGAGQVVPPHEHFLVVGSAPTAVGDALLVSGITDETSVVLKNGAAVVDAVCWNCGTNSFTDHICQGAPVTVTGCGNATDRSIERKPGGVLGNCSDTNSPDDWQLITPSFPQNLSSPPTP